MVNQYFWRFLLSLLQCTCLLHELALFDLRIAEPVRMTASKRRVYQTSLLCEKSENVFYV